MHIDFIYYINLIIIVLITLIIIIIYSLNPRFWAWCRHTVLVIVLINNSNSYHKCVTTIVHKNIAIANLLEIIVHENLVHNSNCIINDRNEKLTRIFVVESETDFSADRIRIMTN